MKTRRFLAVTVGVMVLSIGLVLANYGGGVTPAGADSNPFPVIIDKLNAILTTLTNAAGQNNHTLRWDQALPAAQRFIILPAFNSDAVLDKNTGLVWEKSPTTTVATPEQWFLARVTCATIKTVGGQKAWRLPSMLELSSLVDPSVASGGPTLPPGHPFLNVQNTFYWSATTNAENSTVAWLVDFGTGNVGGSDKTNSFQVWCVRGGMNADQY